MSDTSIVNPDNDEMVQLGFPYPLNQEVEIPLEQIIPNPNQPRRSMRQESLEMLAASMKAKGQLTSAKVRPLSEAERASHPGVWVMLVGGHRRRQAALMNGFKILKCIVDDITPEDTHYQALMDNDHEEMDWWDWDLAIEQESKTFTGTQEALADRLDKGITKVKVALRITKTLNPAARVLVEENLQKTLKNEGRPASSKNKGFLISENTLLVLADLEEPGQVKQALQMVLDDYLTTDQAQKLVEHMKAGHPADTYSPTAKSNPRPATQKPSEPAHTNGHNKEPLAQSNHETQLAASSQIPPTHHSGEGQSAKAESHQSANTTNTSQPASPTKIYLFRDFVAGVNVIHKIQQKVAKGETLTFMESMVLGGYRIGQGAGWLWKHLLKPMLEPVWHQIKKTLGKTFGWIFGILTTVVVVCALAWLVWNFLLHGFHPVNWMESKIEYIFHHESPSLEPTPVPTPPPAVSNLLKKVETAAVQLKPEKKKTEPVVVYQPAVSFAPLASPAQTLYDPKILETEIAAIPQNSIVKDYPFTPDETMPGDLAASRLQDLINADKYTMKIGGDTQKIASVSPSNTTLTITFKSSDMFGGLVNGSNQMNLFWEDVTAVHINQMDVETKIPSVLYQCSLIVSGSKNPLTVQCTAAGDLEHLVSTLEYFIRHSRLGHDAQPGGLPYPTQGLRLNNEYVVKKLWADSPADKASLQLGDHLWSVGKATKDQQEKKDFEKVLQSSLPVTLFVVSSADWTKAQIAAGVGNAIHPKARKVILGAS